MTQDDDEAHNRLIVEQLEHTLDLIRAEISALRAGQEHQEEMTSLRLKTLEGQVADFEKRLRELTESATQFKLMVSLAVGGGFLSLLTLIRSLVGN